MSHFAVLVIGENIEEQLAPFDENLSVEPYRRYWDSEEIRMWEADLATGDGPRLDKPAGTATMEEIAEAYNARYREEDEGVSVDEGGIFEMTTYNPRAKWDWYAVGGRWRGFFKIRDGAVSARVEVGEAGAGENAPRYDADVVTKGDVDLEGMREEAARRAGERWDDVQALIADLPEAETWESVLARCTDDEGKMDAESARAFYGEQERVKAVRGSDLVGWMDGVEDFQIPREQYVRLARDSAACPFAYVKDGKWYGKGKMGWFGMSSDEMTEAEWAREVNGLLDSLPDDTLLTLVDCHI